MDRRDFDRDVYRDYDTDYEEYEDLYGRRGDFWSPYEQEGPMRYERRRQFEHRPRGRGPRRRGDFEHDYEPYERRYDRGERYQRRFEEPYYSSRPEYDEESSYGWDIRSSYGRDYGPSYTRGEFDRSGRRGRTIARQRDRRETSSYESWEMPGPYTGRGPKGYQRSDDRIYEEACERLSRHGYLDARDIELEVNNGEVTLKGSVDSRRAKRMAEDSIESVSGIRDIHNQLFIKQNE